MYSKLQLLESEYKEILNRQRGKDELKESFKQWADQNLKPVCKEDITPRDNVIAVLRQPYFNKLGKKIDTLINWIYTHNLVTNDGDIYYAQQAVTEAPAANEDFEAGRMELRTGTATPAKADTYNEVTTPVTASRKVFETSPNYPLRNDADADNTGSGVDVATYLNNYTTGDFNATAIIGGTIHDNASPVGATKILNHYTIASFNKTASDTLKMIVNHTMNGV